MTWLSDRANAIRGIQGGGANTPNVTNSPDWLARRAEAQRSIIANQPKVVKTTKKRLSRQNHNPLKTAHNYRRKNKRYYQIRSREI